LGAIFEPQSPILFPTCTRHPIFKQQLHYGATIIAQLSALSRYSVTESAAFPQLSTLNQPLAISR
jgi:hypothetical protein